MQTTSPLVSVLAFEVFLVLLIGYRSLLNYRGRPLSVARLVTFPALVLLLWVVAQAETAYAIPASFPLWIALDIGVVVVGALVTVPLAGRLITVYQGPDGRWMYRYGIELIVFYLVSWVVRLVLATVFDPSSLEFTAGTAPTLSPLASSVMLVVQALFSLSTGLVVGRAVVTYRTYRMAESRTAASAPPLA
jgi:hypothetical protein